jgi:hypothetical protein
MEEIKVNSVVICMDTWSEENDPELPFKIDEITVPKKGKEYTIRELITTDYGTGIKLVEITNPKFYFDNIKRHEEPIFAIEQFQLKEE